MSDTHKTTRQFHLFKLQIFICAIVLKQHCNVVLGGNCSPRLVFTFQLLQTHRKPTIVTAVKSNPKHIQTLNNTQIRPVVSDIH